MSWAVWRAVPLSQTTLRKCGLLFFLLLLLRGLLLCYLLRPLFLLRSSLCFSVRPLLGRL